MRDALYTTIRKLMVDNITPPDILRLNL